MIRGVSKARRTALVLTGLVLLSFNLRPAAVSVGPVLEEVRDALDMSGPEAGLLTALPVLAFAIFGALAPAFARTVGLHRAAAVSLVAVVVGLGGRLRSETAAAVGPLTVAALAEINVDVAFLGTNALSYERGLTTPDPDEALVKKTMLAAARQRIFLVDSSKFGGESLARHATLEDIDVLVTDSAVSAEQRRRLFAADVTLEVAQ